MRVAILTSLLMVLSFSLQAQNTAGNYVYDFTDAALAPQYHRSYTITVTPSQASLMVTNYVETLFDQKFPIGKKAYKNFIKKLTACNIVIKTDEADSDGCTGGTGVSFNLPFASKSIEGGVYNCGGRAYGNIGGNIEEAEKLFKSMIPDFAGKLEATRKN